MAFLNFKHQRKSGDQPLAWGRAHIDGAPYRGEHPLMNEQELEAKSERVSYARFGIFDSSRPMMKQFGRTYTEVCEGVLAGWFTMLCNPTRRWVLSKRTGRLKMLIYVEWSEPYMQFRGTVE